MPDCTVVEVIHELGHALGLKHEQQRPDRDKFVTVLTANIEAGETDNFDKLSTADVITTPDCDFQSIMHYKSAAFSANGLPTLLGNNGEPLGNSTSPTLLDAQLVREAYRDHVGVARRSDSGFEAAGAVEHVAVASIFPDRVVTAVRTEAGTLKLIFVDGRPDGGLTRVSDSGDQAGEASDIAIAVGQRIVTALRDGSDDLVLISWDEVLSGPPPRIQRVKDSGDLAGEASLIQILALSPTAFLTACRSASGRLVLISWALNPDGSFTRLDDSGDQAGGVTEISLTLLAARIVGAPVDTALVAATVRTDDGRAKVIPWRVVVDDGSITRGTADSGDSIGKATGLASAVTGPAPHLVVSCRTAAGDLKLITLEVAGGGDSVVRLDDSGNQAGEIGLNALVARPLGVLSAVASSPTAALKLIDWSVDAAGVVTRTGDSSDQAGGVSLIALAEPATSTSPLVTAVRTQADDLALISWEADPAHGEV